MRTAALQLVAGFVLAGGAAPDPLPPAREPWHKLSRPNFTLYSDAGPRELLDLAGRLEALHAALGRVTGWPARSPLPTRVLLFRDERSFRPYREALRPGRGRELPGLYLHSSESNDILIDGSAESEGSGTAYHELTHHFLNSNLPDLPLWFEEGLAELYSSFRVRDGKSEIGHLLEGHVRLLRREPLLPLARLFRVGQGSPEYNERERRGVFYAQSWALVHYLTLGNPERSLGLARFLEALGKGSEPDAAFRSSFGIDPAALEAELRTYIKQDRYPWVSEPRAAGDEGGGEAAGVVRIAPAEALAALGRLLLREPAAASFAEAHFARALALDAAQPLALAGLAELRLRQGREAEAVELFEKAVAGEPADPAPYLAYAEHLAKVVSTDAAERPRAERARALYRRALELDPVNARALSGLGRTYFAGGDAKEGIAALESALRLQPRSSDARLSLIGLYLRVGRREEARRLLDLRPDAELARRARELFLQADVEEANGLLGADRDAEGLAILERVARETSDARLREWVARRIGRVKESAARRRQVERFNEAVGKANAGQAAEAIALLDELLSGSIDPELARAARDLRERLAERRKPR